MRILILLMCISGCPTWADAPKKLLLIGTGPDGHPPSTHEYIDGLKILEQALKPNPSLDITLVKAEGAWANGPELIDRADAIVLFVAEGAKWIQLDEQRLNAFQRAGKRGAGLVALHWATGTKEAKYIDAFVNLWGACHGGPDRKYKDLETTLKPAKHPIADGLSEFTIKDEFYYALKMVKPVEQIKPVLTAKIEDHEHPVAWAWERPNGGRSFGFTGLHFHKNWQEKAYLQMVVRGTLWTMKQPLPAKELKRKD